MEIYFGSELGIDVNKILIIMIINTIDGLGIKCKHRIVKITIIIEDHSLHWADFINTREGPGKVYTEIDIKTSHVGLDICRLENYTFDHAFF